MSDFKDTFDKQEKHMFKPEWEKEKTPDQERMISEVLERLPDFVKKFGGNPVSIKSKNIHFLDAEKIKADGEIKENYIQYDYNNQLVSICPTDNESKTIEVLVHELMHFNSFMSVGQEEKHVSKKGYNTRVGFSIIGEKYLLNDLNEAVTQELAMRFIEDYYKNPYMRKAGEFVSRQSEVSRLNEIMDKILMYNSKEFKSKEEVFRIFAESYFSGNLMKIGRLMDKTFGKGTFRHYAETGDYLNNSGPRKRGRKKYK